MRYLISYDLMAPGKNYEPLWAELRRLGAVSSLASVWVGNFVNTSPKAIGDHFLKFMDANDRIFVTEVPDNYAYRNLIAQPKAA
jgi:hypothetical protein